MKISDLLQLNAVYQKIDAGTTEIRTIKKTY